MKVIEVLTEETNSSLLDRKNENNLMWEHDDEVSETRKTRPLAEKGSIEQTTKKVTEVSKQIESSRVTPKGMGVIYTNNRRRQEGERLIEEGAHKENK